MKKILALVLAMMMVFALCACGSSDDAAADADTTADEAAADAAQDAAAPADAGEAPVDEVEGGDTGEASEEQSFDQWPTDGYDKTFEGYIEYVTDAMNSQTGNPNLESELASLAEVTEDTYSADSQPFQMQIQFGLIISYEDFLNS